MLRQASTSWCNMTAITLQDIGKFVLLDGREGYVLLSVKYTPGGLCAEVLNKNLPVYSVGWYSIEDVSSIGV